MGFFRKRKQAEPKRAPVEVAEPPASSLPTPPPADERGRRSVTDQVDYLVNTVSPLPAFGMYLLDAWGSAVCEDIIADDNQPAADLAAVSGYAIASADSAELGKRGPLSFTISQAAALDKAQQAIPVQAGQVLPAGADAVVAAEDCASHPEEGLITIGAPVDPGENVRWAGSEIRSGSILMHSGERLNARRSAQLALAKIDRVLARPRPRVVVLGIGDENSVVTEDSHLLAALVKSDGAQVWRVVAPMGEDAELRDLISDQLIRADLVVSTGALLPDSTLVRVLASMGETDMADIAQRPGGRVGFALVGEDKIPVLMLPDDPVAAYLAYQLYARPMINRLAGANTASPQRTQRCLLGGDLTSHRGVHEVCFATIRDEAGEKVAVPLGRVGEAKLADMVRANAVIILDESTTSMALGDQAECWLLDD